MGPIFASRIVRSSASLRVSHIPVEVGHGLATFLCVCLHSCIDEWCGRMRWSSSATVRVCAAICIAPDQSAGRTPFIVQGPGLMGLADAKLYEPYHRAFTDAGFALLIFDYRGFGASEGERGTLSPVWQLADWRNAIAYMRGRDDVDAMRGAIFGSGGTGGGNAVLAAAAEPEMRATISQVPIANGRTGSGGSEPRASGLFWSRSRRPAPRATTAPAPTCIRARASRSTRRSARRRA